MRIQGNLLPIVLALCCTTTKAFAFQPTSTGISRVPTATATASPSNQRFFQPAVTSTVLYSGGVDVEEYTDTETSTSATARTKNERQNGVKFALGSFFTTTFAAFLLFFSVDEAAITAYSNSQMLAASGVANNVVASAKEAQAPPLKDVPAPPVTATSSERALKIGADMKELNTRFFGAYWCSHCYEQKQRMGKEAMANIPYIECAKEGLNSQADLCKERKVPGYPTWEINGKLYPGEMYLDELEDIIVKIRKDS
jgi:protein-disulfide isomerase